MTHRCTCGHTIGVHAHTNRVASCAFPGCKCFKYQVQQITITPKAGTAPVKIVNK